ncbi:GNAT family N-acetyltransferase [Bradyrhizobium sp. AUGA SZCCT0283]|uniref:GNAT family N-acetyltransferase n=1 Tax=Bradyrhizobium sp. AUGA SZCCT0283 TaxID=2807671 RepID=UPI001BAD2362|nr:N-acetyltransferase [Bradyrhizobium sp. AUGA SZCCT0283]MBR1276517.1 N-acetyltransferase [Bradyrhizobium sp. AUGA SZCCT0283]
MIVRSETPGDVAAIRAVEKAAFRQPAEAQLVDDLRDAGDSVFSLVAVEGETVIGHAIFSRLQAPFPALALGPVAVWPERQRSGVGSQLIREGIARSEAAGWLGIFVLGNPAFYRRFGFDAGKASGFISPYAGPHWMALPLGRSELPTSTGSIQHAPAFAKPG